jgi:iron complex transport system permease protein
MSVPAFRRRALLLASAGALLVLAVLAVGVGPVPISIGEALAIAGRRLGLDLGSFTDQQAMVLEAIRLPRVLLGVLVGAGLAVSGAALQGVFRNPLVDPGLIGVSSGAALGAAVGLVLGPRFGLPAALGPLAAFLGGCAATLLVAQVARAKSEDSSAVLVLVGIAVNALAGASIGILTFLSTDAQLRNFTFWSFGSLANATWQSLAIVTPPIALAVFCLARLARPLDAMLLGESEAGHLGHDVRRVRLVAILASALGVGAAVAVSGLIGFVGLVVPHIARLMLGSRHALVLPLSGVLGGALIVASDLAARTTVAPAELPIGVVTALAGAPFFLFLIFRERRRGVTA